MNKAVQSAHRFSHHAMATLFEVLIDHEDSRYAEQAAFAAFLETNRLEQILSRFIENSDISRINQSPAGQSIQVEPDTISCLKKSLSVQKRTRRAFDVTACPAKPRTKTTLRLDEKKMTVKRLDPSVQIDLGGIGKGFAVDRMADMLGEWDIESALLHGGASSALALKAPQRETGWKVTVSRPLPKQTPRDVLPPQVLETIHLQNQALSGSGLQKGQHIVDPRTGRPTETMRAAWSLCSSATMGDALSTAFMVMSVGELQAFCANNPGIGAMAIIEDDRGDERMVRFGEWGNP